MKEEKIPYGWFTFHRNGYVGIKDYDGNEVISPTLGFTEIGELLGITAIATRQGKKGLIDTAGNPRCEFRYDRLVYIGEGCYKAGRLIRGNPTDIVLEYKDTRYEYEIINAEGKRLCGDYHYISEVYNGEVTAAINGRCGIVNLEGVVIIPFEHKYVQSMGEGMYLLSEDGCDNYYTTVVDKNLNVMIPASMKYREVMHFHHGAAVAFQNEKWGVVDTHGNHLCEFKFSFIQDCGENYFRVEMGAKKNIMRPDGSLVLREWHHDVYDVTHGFFIFGNTIRKSKTNPKTRYIHGLAHVNGDIIFPAIFDRMWWFDDKRAIYAQIGTKPYILTTDGSIYDPTGQHLPERLNIDEQAFQKDLADWVLHGLQFYYRDTNARIDASRIYRVGDTIRAGFFVDATTKLQKPGHRTRFLIASAHAAKFYEMEPMVKENPDIGRWDLATFHYNSYFKVMDVYETTQCTQVFLLHIPMSAAILLQGAAEYKFLDEDGTGAVLVLLARNSLDEKLRMGYHERSFDEELCERMEDPIGLNDDMSFCSLAPAPESEDKQVANLSELIHILAKDDDIDFKVELSDNFPWNGVKGTICEGCFFANSIVGKGEGCSQVNKEEFRNSHFSGQCEHWKKDANTPSLFEKKQIWEQRERDKQTDVFALNMVKDFIKERLDGDINLLRDFDLRTLSSDDKYGADNVLSRMKIVRAIMSLAFADCWPDLNYDSIEHYKYDSGYINYTSDIFGGSILDEYFKGMDKYHPSREQHLRAVKVHHMMDTIGNLMVTPSKAPIGSYGSAYRYADKYLYAMYDVFTEQKTASKDLKNAFWQNRKMMKDYQGEVGYYKFIRNMMLEDYVDGNGLPMEIFDNVRCWQNDLDRDDYFRAVDKFCTFCEVAIPKRGERIIEKLKTIIK